VNYRRDAPAAEQVVAEIRAAGRKASAFAASVDDPEQDATMVRAFAAHHLCRLLVPQMRERPRADVVLVSSVAGAQPMAGGAPYSMAKAALEALARSLAQEEMPHGIRVNVVAPGLVATDMGDRLAKAVTGVGEAAELDARAPFGRVCRPEDVADVVAFLVCTRYVNGERITVDGGASPLR
jgi:NAD(P)-dependent dehydrogenase (short-subunit alcohol dehydrogenase family)